jgi:hypothetical protein
LFEQFQDIAPPVSAILPRTKANGLQDSFIVPISKSVWVAIQELAGLL